MAADVSAGLAPQVTAQQATGAVTQEAVGQTGTITDPATVRGQLKDITTDIENAMASGSLNSLHLLEVHLKWLYCHGTKRIIC